MFEVIITEKKESVLNIILSIVFIIIGTAFFVEGIPTKTITIVPAETQVNAYLHRRSTLPPFKSIDKFVPNVKQAILEKETNYRTGRALNYYSVVLETYDEKKINLTDSSLLPVSWEKLQNQINESIQNKTPFTKTFREDFLFFFGLTLIIVGIFLQWYEYRKRKENKEIQEVKINEERKQLLNTLQKRVQQNNRDYQNSNKKD